MRERYTKFDFFKDACFETDKKIKPKQSPLPRINEQTNWQVRATPAHKPGVADGKK
jgi:hypothetical protein